jgi:hypothetical protein
VIAPGRPNRFGWLDEELWIDRQRWLVLALTTAKRIGCADADTVPAALYEEIEMSGCRHSSTLPSRIAELVAAFVAGSGADRRNGPLIAEFMNHAVIQPLVNPAYASLFWLELGWELHPRNQMSTTLGTSVGPMAIDLALYPASKSEAPQVRTTQIAWVRERFPLDGDWQSANDEAWAKRCAEILRDHEPKLLFQEIQGRALRLAGK